MDQLFLLHQIFDAFDEFCVYARNWNHEYRQIESGPFSGELLMADIATEFTNTDMDDAMIQLNLDQTRNKFHIITRRLN